MPHYSPMIENIDLDKQYLFKGTIMFKTLWKDKMLVFSVKIVDPLNSFQILRSKLISFTRQSWMNCKKKSQPKISAEAYWNIGNK